jgi:hypothetical protein
MTKHDSNANTRKKNSAQLCSASVYSAMSGSF